MERNVDETNERNIKVSSEMKMEGVYRGEVAH